MKGANPIRTPEQIAEIVAREGKPIIRAWCDEGTVESGPIGHKFWNVRLGRVELELSEGGETVLEWPDKLAPVWCPYQFRSARIDRHSRPAHMLKVRHDLECHCSMWPFEWLDINFSLADWGSGEISPEQELRQAALDHRGQP